ncbi:MAG TPA: hypothetical protein VD995_20490 [Azospirillum sp.]|nr:hypothetical protein [Azospirillum sp.]
MRFRLFLGAALLPALIALNGSTASAQNRSVAGKICVENAGAFVIGTQFSFTDGNVRNPSRTVDVGYYPVLQTRCADFYTDDWSVRINVEVAWGVGKECEVVLNRHVGNTVTAKMHGTTFINKLECPW